VPVQTFQTILVLFDSNSLRFFYLNFLGKHFFF
jgi:hypothetical protein